MKKTSIKLLKGEGYLVPEAQESLKAIVISALRESPIQLLLVGVELAEMSGGNLAQRLTWLRAGINGLYVSGYPGEAIVQDGFSRPDAKYLQKPLTRIAFTSRIALRAPTVGGPTTESRLRNHYKNILGDSKTDSLLIPIFDPIERPQFLPKYPIASRGRLFARSINWRFPA